MNEHSFTKVRDMRPDEDWRQHATLYRVEPPLRHGDRHVDHVIISAARAGMFNDDESVAWGATADGTVVTGAITDVGDADHAAMIAELGGVIGDLP